MTPGPAGAAHGSLSLMGFERDEVSSELARLRGDEEARTGVCGARSGAAAQDRASLGTPAAAQGVTEHRHLSPAREPRALAPWPGAEHRVARACHASSSPQGKGNRYCRNCSSGSCMIWAIVGRGQRITTRRAGAARGTGPLDGGRLAVLSPALVRQGLPLLHRATAFRQPTRSTRQQR